MAISSNCSTVVRIAMVRTAIGASPESMMLRIVRLSSSVFTDRVRSAASRRFARWFVTVTQTEVAVPARSISTIRDMISTWMGNRMALSYAESRSDTFTLKGPRSDSKGMAITAMPSGQWIL
jgi:hypothetical protein